MRNEEIQQQIQNVEKALRELRCSIAREEEAAGATRITLTLDADEAGAIFAACDMLLHSASGEGPYLDAARRVFDRLRRFLPNAQKGR
jgi:hypothetical protein